MKNYIDIFIKRPILSTAISLFILLAGMFSMQYLSLRLFPKISLPVISIHTHYPGASGKLMSEYVTTLLQTALSGIDGINYIESSSMQSNSEIKMVMKMGYDPNAALSAVMAKTEAVADQLPKTSEKPLITLDTSDNDPTMILAVTSNQLARREVADYLRRSIKPKLETITGVSEAQVLGRTSAMRLWLNPIKMAEYQISAQDIIKAIQNSNVLTAAGKTQGQITDFTIQSMSDLHSNRDFNNIFIKQTKNGYVQFKDIGRAIFEDRDIHASAFYNGLAATMIFIKLIPGANPIIATEQIKKILPDLNNHLPFDMHIHNVVDSGRYIHEAMKEVLQTLCVAALIVIFVIYFFLGSLRSTLIPIITIPLSLIGVCTFLFIFGFSINTLTLLAMVLAIGLVVDDAIVVVENISRHLENGLSVYDATKQGAREIFYPVIAMSITLAAVYIPIGFANGLTGELFKEFSFTLAGCVILSGIIAITLSPMLCNQWLKVNTKNNMLLAEVNNFYYKMINCYNKVLNKSLQHYSLFFVIWILLIVITSILLLYIPRELAPEEDQGLLIAMSSAPQYTNTNFLDKNLQNWINKLKHVSTSDAQIVLGGIPNEHQSLSFISLKDWNERKQSAMQLQAQLQNLANEVPGLQITILNPASLPGDDGLPLQIVLKSSLSYEELLLITNNILKEAWNSGLFQFIKSDLNYDQPILKMDINRNKIAMLGMTMQQMSETLSLLLGENKLQQFIRDNLSYYVIPEVEAKYRINPKELSKIHLKTQSGKFVPLSSVATIKKMIGPEHYNQFQKMNSITISGQMAAGYTLSHGVQFFNNLIKNLSVPIMVDYAGQTRQFIEEGHRLLWIFIAGIVIIFFILAIQFNSYRLPFIILFGTTPFALLGAALTLILGFGTLNLYTQIGLLTLVGLISKHGILIVEFANQLQLKGMNKFEAITEASLMRFRPIMMTTAAMVLGALPLCLASGAGSCSRFQLGMVISSGMLCGTFFTLLILPPLYFLLTKERVNTL